MEPCIFCKLVANEIPSYTVYEDGDTRAFLDIFGATDGHTMVVLKKHGETILSYTPEELRQLWTSVQKVAGAIEKAFDTNILSIGINHGEPKGVKHLHVHIMPRFPEDGGGIMQSLPNRKLSNKDFGMIARMISSKL
jgi:histidine triad (HIT) family protein